MSELYHHGILGMKWGVRRYRNKDGTLTEAGKKRYYSGDYYLSDKGRKEFFEGNSSRMTEAGKTVLNAHGRDSEIGKAIRQTEFTRKYAENWANAWNKMADRMNKGKLDEFNKEWDSKHGNEPVTREYYEEYGKIFRKEYEDVLLSEFGEHPVIGKEWVQNAFFYGMFDDPDDWMD